ncbi:hypothetical protein WMF18_15770 [Sorangium sp. So ce315]|uniref:hypothetical protein n=1 Tax=Sorangium sp. So ce315 TaxID=3133299 RepID=UPI003F60B34A
MRPRRGPAGNGVETGYAHLSRFAAGLKRGDHVATHQLADQRDAFRAEKAELDRELDDIGDPLPAAPRPGGGGEPASPANDSASQPRAAASGARRQRR